MGQSIQEWTKYRYLKAVFHKVFKNGPTKNFSGMFSTNFNWSIFEYFVLYFEQKKQFLFYTCIFLYAYMQFLFYICIFLMKFFKTVALIAFVTEVLCSLIQLEQREKIVSDIFCTIDPNFYSFQICCICFRILINKEKHR